MEMMEDPFLNLSMKLPPKPKGFWELDSNLRFESPSVPSLWKQFWVWLFFGIKWYHVINKE